MAVRQGYQLVPRGQTEPFATDEYDVVPRGREEPFATEGYEVTPRGRYDHVVRDYYSPVPHLELLPDDIFDRRSRLGGIDLQVERAMRFVETDLAPYVAELDVPRDGPADPGQFYLLNRNYEAADAELLYAMIRWRRPRRVVELGSGFTTLLINQACHRNAEDGAPVDHVAYDPYPRRQILGEELPPGTRFEATSATDVPLEVFAGLEQGDVLFVDTTHTVKLGSDVNFIVLDVLPELAPGVVVHFHDVFLPWEYPRAWFEGEPRYLWAEQYLLQAFLAFNREFEVLLPVHAVSREHPARLRAVVPSVPEQTGVGGALWLRRCLPAG
jgi:hypothetical protein